MSFAPTYQGYNLFSPSLSIGPSTSVNLYSLDPNQRTSYAIQMSSSIQRQIGQNGVIEVGYTGTLGIKLQQNVQLSNTLPGPRPPRQKAVSGAQSSLPAPCFPPTSPSPAIASSAAPSRHCPTRRSPTITRYNSRGAPLYAGFSYLSSFTFSKAITDAPQFRNAGGATGTENSPPQNSYDLAAERGLAAFNAKFPLGQYCGLRSPFGKAQHWLTSGVASAILGGWQIAAIQSFQTGFPSTINLTGDTANIGGGSGGILIRADPVDGREPRTFPEASAPRRYVQHQRVRRSARLISSALSAETRMVGPGLFNIDTTLSKRFRIKERVGAEIRARRSTF